MIAVSYRLSALEPENCLEKNPQIVARLAAEREDENWRFRTFVKMARGAAHARLNQLAEQFDRQAEAQTDCTTCGACCRDNCVPVTPEEHSRLAARIEMSNEEFERRHMTQDDDGEPAIDARPCPFLTGTVCSVYEDRPEPCRGYPYIGGEIEFRMLGVIERAGTCPIVFDMLEKLKQAVGFRRYQ